MTRTILVVDDDPIQRKMLALWLEEEGFVVETAADGVEAHDRIVEDPEAWEVIVLDRLMPRMEGLELLRQIKALETTRHIPVVLQTAVDSERGIREGIEAGAFYYLTKPCDRSMLLTIVQAAISDHCEVRRLKELVRERRDTLDLLRHGSFEMQTISEAHGLATLLASLCPDPSTVISGLTELFVNAIEHGNLEIGYEEKSRLRQEGTWVEEIKERLARPGLADRTVSVEVRRRPETIEFTITDQGSGFDWKPFLEIDPSRAFHNHGRGIAMAKLLSFDRLEFRGSGNEVVGTVSLVP